MRTLTRDQWQAEHAAWKEAQHSIATLTLMAHTAAGVLVARSGSITGGRSTLTRALDGFRASHPNHHVTVGGFARPVELRPGDDIPSRAVVRVGLAMT